MKSELVRDYNIAIKGDSITKLEFLRRFDKIVKYWSDSNLECEHLCNLNMLFSFNYEKDNFEIIICNGKKKKIEGKDLFFS